MSTKVIISTYKKIKSPKNKRKTKSLDKSLDKYKAFIVSQEETTTVKPISGKSVSLKRPSPKKKVTSKVSKIDLKDINDIEKKMLQIKNDSAGNSVIQMPTQNIMEVHAESPTGLLLEKNPGPTKKHVNQKGKVSLKSKGLSKGLSKGRGKGLSKGRGKGRSRSTRSKGPKSRLKGRKISIKTRVFNENDIKKVESRIKEIRSKKKSDIKKELTKQGIKVSGKSDRLLKDIYFYSQMSNINIIHEK